MLSGVPQGSVLGPLLFVIMMIDIDEDVAHSQLSSYADDTRIWRFIRDEADRSLLQEDLNSLYKWTEKNNAVFNCDKFEGISYPDGVDGSRIYKSPDNLDIENKDTIKDLGVYISSDFTFSEHIKIAVKETKDCCMDPSNVSMSRKNSAKNTVEK